MGFSGISARFWVAALLLAGGLLGATWNQQPITSPPLPQKQLDGGAVKKFVSQHCTHCHNSDDKKGGLDLDTISSAAMDAHPQVWEKVVRKLTTRQMPP